VQQKEIANLRQMEILPVNITRMQSGSFSKATDELAVEEPLQIQLLYGVPGQEQRTNLAITMRTPGNDEELAAGFLFTEDIIRSSAELKRIIAGATGENTVLAILEENLVPELVATERNFYMTSSCGVCGKSSIDAVRKEIKYPGNGGPLTITASVLQRLPGELRKQQEIFKSTGGLHAAALFDSTGKFLSLREDVGRHNALDKIIGDAFLRDQLPLRDAILLLSGRASFELVQKAAMAGIRVIAAIGAPSSLAVQLADEAHITLVGFLKTDRFNIYSGAMRITEDQADFFDNPAKSC
jgi:FdhD protein